MTNTDRVIFGALVILYTAINAVCLHEAAQFANSECHSAPAFVTPEAAESLGY